MITLANAISTIGYTNSFAIYAKADADGQFTPNSPARIGQTQFENGGLLDDMVLFANGEQVGDKWADWTRGIENESDEDFEGFIVNLIFDLTD